MSAPGDVDLPAGEWQPPTCGVCGDDLDSIDTDVWMCADCSLRYTGADLVPGYLDETDPPCRHVEQRWSAAAGVFDCECRLPAGHPSHLHWGSKP